MRASPAEDSRVVEAAGEPPRGLADFVAWALDRYGERLALALGLNVEGTILLHLLDAAASRSALKPRVFTIDTGRLHGESYELLERLRSRYHLPLEIYFPRTPAVEALYRARGPLSFFESVDNRKECCAIRKVEPLGRALEGVDAWMAGLRRAQGPTRASTERIERDADGRSKLSPLAEFTDEEVWEEARRLQVPVHPLHLRGYPSIGCAPCTRAVQPGEPARAGRWWWEDESLRECGIHRRSS